MSAVTWKSNGEKSETNVVNGNEVVVWYKKDETEWHRSFYKDGEEVRD